MGRFILAAVFCAGLASAASPLRVLVFVRTDCPISNRYAPELHRIWDEFHASGVEFSLVYADPSETEENIARHGREFNFGFPAVRDPGQKLVKQSHVTVTPEAALFNAAGELVYHGRIDDKYVDIGKTRPVPTKHDLEAAIEAALAGKPIAEPATRAVGCYLADVR